MTEREDTPFALALEATTRQLSRVLPLYGFAPEPIAVTQPSGWRRQWRRDRGWIRDVVDLPYRRGGEIAIFINVQVELPVNDGWHVFEARGVPQPRVPAWFAARRAEAYAGKVGLSVQRQNRWLDQYRTPARALRAAVSPQRNHAKSGPLFESMVVYLRHQKDRLAEADRATLAPWLAMTTEERQRQLDEWAMTYYGGSDSGQETLNAIARSFEEAYLHVPGISNVGAGLAFTYLALSVFVEKGFDHTQLPTAYLDVPLRLTGALG